MISPDRLAVIRVLGKRIDQPVIGELCDEIDRLRAELVIAGVMAQRMLTDLQATQDQINTLRADVDKLIDPNGTRP